MPRFFNPEAVGGDMRLHAPATARNRDYILDILKPHLPESGTVLEIASGTGEHAVYIAPHFPHLAWQPTDIDPAHLASIEAWRTESEAPNLLPPVELNVLENWPLEHLSQPLAAISAINLIHIAPWAVAETLIEKAGGLLPEKGILYLYGPYKRGGDHTAPSNEAFHQNLQARDPAWGVRDMEAVIELGLQCGFAEPIVQPMPANNFSLIFKKQGA